MATYRIVDLISEARSYLHSDHSRLAFTGTTTSVGTTTTFVCTALNSTLLDRKGIAFTSGTNQGLRRLIDSWNNSTKTGTLLESLAAAVANSVTFQIGDAGFFSDFDFLPWLQAAISKVFKMVHPNALEDLTFVYTANAELMGGLNYGKVDLPSDSHLSIMKEVYINDVPAPVYDRAKDAWNFTSNRFIDRGIMPMGFEEPEDPQIAYVKPRPDDTQTVKIRYIKKVLVASVGASVIIPEKIKEAVILNVVSRAWAKRERADMVTLYRNKFRDELTALKAEE